MGRVGERESRQAPVVVLGSASATLLGVVRGFGRRGIPVLVISGSPSSAGALRSRYIKRCYFIRTWSSQELAAVLEEIGPEAGENPLVVLPTSDASLLAFNALRGGEDSRFKDALPEKSLLETCLSKALFADRVQALGIIHPPAVSVRNEAALSAAADREWVYPVILKPDYSHLFVQAYGKKVLLAGDARELRLEGKQLLQNGLPFLVQAHIPGQAFYQVCYYHHPERGFWNGLCLEKVRQLPPDNGVGTLVTLAERPEMVALARQIVERLGLRGQGEVEFKLDPETQEACLLEINARPVTFNRLCARCGLDAEYLYYLDSLGLSFPEEELSPSISAGDGWLDFRRDVSGLVKDWRQLSRGLRMGGVRVHAYWAADDPQPFQTEWWGSLKWLFDWLVRRRPRKNGPAGRP